MILHSRHHHLWLQTFSRTRLDRSHHVLDRFRGPLLPFPRSTKAEPRLPRLARFRLCEFTIMFEPGFIRANQGFHLQAMEVVGYAFRSQVSCLTPP